MRIKKIPEGQQIISFSNRYDRDCILHLDRKPFLVIPANSFKIIEAKYFLVGHTLKEFPAMQLYSNLRIEVDYR